MYRQALHINTLWAIHYSHLHVTSPVVCHGGQEVKQGLVVDFQVGYSDSDEWINGMCSCFEDLYKDKEFVSGGASSQTELLAIYVFPEKLFITF